MTAIDVFDPRAWFEKHLGEREKFNHFVRQYEQYADKNIFLTTETFWGRLSSGITTRKECDIIKFCNAIKRFFFNHEINIVLHLRRADLYFESLYKQIIKSGRVFKIQDVVARKNQKSFFSLLAILEESFGRQNIIIRPFEKSQMFDGCLIADTLHVLDINDDCVERGKISNIGLHRDLCESLLILRKGRKINISNENLLLISDILRNKLKYNDNKYIFSVKERNEIISSFSDFYRYIEYNFYNGKELFVEPFPDDRHLNYMLPDSSLKVIEGLINEYSEK